MASYDFTVTWRLGDGRLLDLPACVAYGNERSDAGRVAESMAAAVEHNLVDFADELDDEALPVKVQLAEDGGR